MGQWNYVAGLALYNKLKVKLTTFSNLVLNTNISCFSLFPLLTCAPWMFPFPCVSSIAAILLSPLSHIPAVFPSRLNPMFSPLSHIPAVFPSISHPCCFPLYLTSLLFSPPPHIPAVFPSIPHPCCFPSIPRPCCFPSIPRPCCFPLYPTSLQFSPLSHVPAVFPSIPRPCCFPLYPTSLLFSPLSHVPAVFTSTLHPCCVLPLSHIPAVFPLYPTSLLFSLYPTSLLFSPLPYPIWSPLHFMFLLLPPHLSFRAQTGFNPCPFRLVPLECRPCGSGQDDMTFLPRSLRTCHRSKPIYPT